MTIKSRSHISVLKLRIADFFSEDKWNIMYDSYMIPDSDLSKGTLRMLEVDID